MATRRSSKKGRHFAFVALLQPPTTPPPPPPRHLPLKPGEMTWTQRPFHYDNDTMIMRFIIFIPDSIEFIFIEIIVVGHVPNEYSSE